MGTIDGLKYLAKHFQIVIFNRDTDIEDYGKNYSQINEISKYIAHNDILVDAIYTQSSSINQTDQENDLKKTKNDKGQFTIPLKSKDIWEDYKQIYLDFGLNNDIKVRDKVLFVNSFDGDYNAKQEEIKIDPVGYFLIDANSKPSRPLT